MRILITGSKGFIGSHLLPCLKKLGHETLGIDKDNCDLINLEKLAALVKEAQPEAIFHLAGQLPGLNTEPESFLRNNVHVTFNILESAKDIQDCRFIFASTMNVYGKPRYLPVDEAHPIEPINIYGLTKILGEDLCKFYAKNFGYKVIVLRYSGVFGPGRESGAISSFISMALKGETIEIDSDGSDKWDTAYVKDVVHANIRALERIDDIKYDIFNIGYGKGLVVKDVAEKIVKITDSASRIKFNQEKGRINFYYDISKARERLGFIPASFEENIRDFIAHKKSESSKICPSADFAQTLSKAEGRVEGSN